ncbi:nucleotide-diphospho-sugar transferase [Melampsora americana]|nr:nucleotide-diphospho-sugar transferase [Melampsora americana]
MFTRSGPSNQYTLLQQSPLSPGIKPETPSSPSHHQSRFRLSLKSPKIRKIGLFVTLSTAVILLVVYPALEFITPGSVALPEVLRFGPHSAQLTPSSDPTSQHSATPPQSHPTEKTAEFSSSSKTVELSKTLTSSSSESKLAEPVVSPLASKPPVSHHVSTPTNPSQPSLSPSSPSQSVPLSAPAPPSGLSTPSTLPHINQPSAPQPLLINPSASTPLKKTLCDHCGCSTDGTLNRSFNQPDLLGPAFLDASRIVPGQTVAPSTQTRTMGQIWASIRDVYCQHPMLSPESAVNLLDNTATDSPSLSTRIQWNLTNTVPSIPTLYLFTKTSRLGRTNALRPDYFRRHVKTITTHMDRVRSRGGKYFPETETKWGTGPRQLIWLIVEDGEQIAPEVEAVFRASQIPFIYLAYGSTHRYGNAQQNAAYALIHRLSRSVYGHGPIVSIDDDGNLLPDLFDLAWRVKRLGVWPMGNLGPTGWEGPKYDPITHAFIGWQKSAKDNRRFPVDNGAFAFSTEVFGTGRMIGPRYWPTDYPGGESEFVSQILTKMEEVEPLCFNCRVAWHNQALSPPCIAHDPKCREFDIPSKP